MFTQLSRASCDSKERELLSTPQTVAPSAENTDNEQKDRPRYSTHTPIPALRTSSKRTNIYKMLDVIDFITERGGDPEKIRESQRRRSANVEVVDEIIALFEDHRRSKSINRLAT